MKLNYKVVKKREQDLIYFNGFIPFQFFSFIDMLKRNTYLKSVGKFDEINAVNFKHRRDMSLSGDRDLYLDKMLKGWVAQNPDFKDCVIS